MQGWHDLFQQLWKFCFVLAEFYTVYFESWPKIPKKWGRHTANFFCIIHIDKYASIFLVPLKYTTKHMQTHLLNMAWWSTQRLCSFQGNLLSFRLIFSLDKQYNIKCNIYIYLIFTYAHTIAYFLFSCRRKNTDWQAAGQKNKYTHSTFSVWFIEYKQMKLSFLLLSFYSMYIYLFLYTICFSS